MYEIYEESDENTDFVIWLKKPQVQGLLVTGRGTLTVGELQKRVCDPDRQQVALQFLLYLEKKKTRKYDKLLEKCTNGASESALEVTQRQWREAIDSDVLRAFLGEEHWEAAKALGEQTEEWAE